MRNILLLFLLFGWGLSVNGQTLAASIEIIQKPQCRTANWQSGNGVLEGSFSGAIGSVEVQWLDSTMTEFSNQTVPSGAIRGPGKYYFRVVDINGNVAMDSIVVDSINPEANFEIISPDFIYADQELAYASAQIRLENIPDEERVYVNPNEHFALSWNLNLNDLLADQKWIETIGANAKIDTIFHKPGIYKTCLVEKNYNGCTDTLCKEITIISPFGHDSRTTVSAFPNFDSQTIQFHTKDFSEFHLINIYSAGGKLVQNETLNAPIQTLDFKHAKGVYVFSLILNDESISSGKFVFGP